MGSCAYAEQLLFSSAVKQLYDYVFSENGLVAFKDGQLHNKSVSWLTAGFRW